MGTCHHGSRDISLSGGSRSIACRGEHVPPAELCCAQRELNGGTWGCISPCPDSVFLLSQLGGADGPAETPPAPARGQPGVPMEWELRSPVAEQ